MSDPLVRNVMNSELVSVRATDGAAFVLDYLSTMGVHSAPVLDDESFAPLGVISRSDLAGELVGVIARDRMTSPAVSVGAEAPLGDAEVLIADTGLHHLVVVDESGRAMGMVSSIDVIRARLGRDTPHPATFDVHADPKLAWSDDRWLLGSELDHVDDGPGAFVIVDGDDARPDVVVWAESTDTLRTRLDAFRREPPEHLKPLLHAGPFKFRIGAPR